MKCKSTKRDGTPCTLEARGESAYCWAHDPTFREERKASASKAGSYSKTTREIASVKKELRTLAREVKSGEVTTAVASVMSQVLGVWLRACETARKERELEELAERLEALEQAQVASPGPGGSRRWR